MVPEKWTPSNKHGVEQSLAIPLGKSKNIYKKLADEKGLCIGYASAQGEFAPKFLHYIVLRADWLQLVPHKVGEYRVGASDS